MTYSPVNYLRNSGARQGARKKGYPKVLEIAFEKVLRRVLRRCLAVDFQGKGSDKGS